MTVRFGRPNLTARVSIAVLVTCTPLDPPNVFSFENVSAQVSQAAGKLIAHGSISVFASATPSSMNPTPLMFSCDGTEQTVVLTIPAATDGPPFKRDKQAVFTVSASASANPPVCCNTVSQTASTGAVALKLK